MLDNLVMCAQKIMLRFFKETLLKKFKRNKKLFYEKNKKLLNTKSNAITTRDRFRFERLKYV